MIYQEIVTEIKKMPVKEQIALMDILARQIRQQIAKPVVSESSLARVRGLLAGGNTPDKAEIRDAYTDYLLEKYA